MEVITINTQPITILPSIGQQQQKTNIIVGPWENSKLPNRTNVAANGTVDPLIKKSDIDLVKSELLNCSGKYGLRNYTIFTLGINVGLRCGDLIRLKVEDVFNPDGSFKEVIRIKESKTTKYRNFGLRESVKMILREYFDTFENQTVGNQYLFVSQKLPENNIPFIINSNGDLVQNKDYIEPDALGKTHLKRNSFGNILNNQIQQQLKGQLSKMINLNTHSQRKTFARNFYDEAIRIDKASNEQNNTNKNTYEQFALSQLMTILNHSSLAQTIKYIGIEHEMIMDVYDMEGI